MSTWKNLCKRGFAVFLSLTLCLSLMNVSAFAAETEDTGSDDSSISDTQNESDTSTESGEDEDGASESAEDGNGETQTPAEGEDDVNKPVEGENGETQTPDEGEDDANKPVEGENGETQTPDEGEDDANKPAEGENGETQTPAEGEDDANKPVEGENGETQTPDEGEDDANKPAEGENGETQTPDEGEGDANKPVEGENGETQTPDEEETSGALGEFLSKIEAIGSGELDMDGILSAIDDCLSSYEQLSEEEKAALAEARDALLTYQGELTGVLPDPIAPQLPELPEVPQAPQYSDAVQAFLDAAAQLPEEVTEENVEEVGAALEALLPLYQSLSEEEQNLDVVVSAYIRVMAVYEQYTGVMAQLMDGVAATIGETPYATLQEAVDAVQEGETITLTAPVIEDITASNDVSYTLDLGGFTVTGTGKGTVITVKSGSVTIDNGTITGGRVIEGNGGGVYVKSGASVTLERNGVISGNVAEWAWKRGQSQGGGVYVAPEGTFILNGGTITNNRAGDPSGVSDAWEDANVNVNACGGGIYAAPGATFVMKDGTISSNIAVQKGGGICLNAGVSGMQGPVNATILAGTISDNTAYTGGAIYLDPGTELNLKSAVVDGNAQVDDAGKSPWSKEKGNGGGGIWFCGMGTGYFYATRGAYISGNTSKTWGDDFNAETSWSGKTPHVPTRLYDGTPLTWYPDGKSGTWCGGRYTEGTEAIADLDAFMDEWLEHEWSNVSMHSETSGNANDAHYAIRIVNNTAHAEGGGIACNGVLIMGEDNDKTLTVKKVWSDAGEVDHSADSVTVNVKRDGKVIDTVTLSAANEWTATLIDLPADGTYTVEEVKVEGYDVSYSEIATDAEGNWTVTVTNTPTPDPSKLTVTKVWSDGNENHAADAVKVEVLNKDGKVVETVTLNSENGWKAEVVIPDSDLSGYSVREADVKEGYTAEAGTISKAEGSETEWTVTVTNNLIPPPLPTKGNLLIIKQVNGGGSEAKNKTYTFTVTGPNGFSQTVTITGEGSSLLEDLEPGVYTVTEDRDGAVISGYTLTISGSGSSAAVVAGGTENVTVTNTYTTPGGGDPGDPEDPEDPTTPPPTPEIPDEEVPLTDIPEEDVPLTEIPEEPEELEIPEENVPLAEVPETGDLSGNWMMAMLMGALGMIWMALTGKKRSEEEG